MEIRDHKKKVPAISGLEIHIFGGEVVRKTRQFCLVKPFLGDTSERSTPRFFQTCLQTCREVISQINQVIQNKKGNSLRNNMTSSVETEIDAFKKFLIAILSKLNLKSVFSLRFSVVVG